MSRNSFGDIRVFVEVARRGGFRAAAEHLQQAPATVSEAIQRFEDQLGVRLFERSTRSVALTPIGEQFYARSLPAVSDIEGALSALDEEKDEVSGTLRLSAPYSAGPFFLDDLLARFAIAYPSVAIEVIYDDRKVDLLTSGIDAAIRSQTLMAPDTHAVPVGPELKMAIVAARGYLDTRGTPQHPHDVLDHDTICYAFGRGDRLAPWGFTRANGAFVVQPKPRLIANDMRSLLHYAAQGLGLAYVYAEIAAPYIAKNDLVEVLGSHLAPMPRYSLNYQSKRHMTRRLRAFLDLVKNVSYSSGTNVS
ncbi:LysR family transcriptional regulator [uncultured Tateyamaria sp.]|uniref:LysR family transcriptional regulator n=1 Tax=uncultured Tateyamaria sp. TaxID=455651 RepID=UPI0026155468|nr:LysR family transcriptional regulator [uncultured Tateyamaria sp.]